MKTITTVCIDSELYKEAKLANLIISNITEEAIRMKLSLIKDETEGLDKQLLELELAKEEKKHSKSTEKLLKIRQKLEKIDQLLAENEQKRLEKEREIMEKATKCINCGGVLEGKKSHKFNNGSVCNGCFMSSTGDQVKKWNQTSQ